MNTLALEVQAFNQAVAKGTAAPGTFRSQQTAATLVDDRVVIDAIATENGTLKAALESMGAAVTAVAGRIVSARVPLGQLPTLEGLGSLQFARPALATTRSGVVTSQGDAAQHSQPARTNRGVEGTGSTIGVLSDSFDCSGDGSYAADQAGGDLPSGVTILDDTACPGSDEGRAMAQILYDVAPGARLAFHTAFNGEADFAQGIIELASAGSTIIVDDVIYFAEPMFQDGVVAQAVDSVAAEGVAYFSSAGNNGRESYEAAFDGSGQTGPVGGELHDFDPGPNKDTRLTIQQEDDSTYIMQWQDPFFSVSGPPGAGTDLDICFYFPPGAASPFACSNDLNTGRDPLEGTTILGNAALEISIERRAGPPPDPVKLVVFGAIAFAETYPGTNAGTIYGHANAAGANAVGASAYFFTPAFGLDPPLLNSYSSAGITPILFDTAGNPIDDVRQKPEFSAPDGGNNTFFGNDYEPDGFPNFFGTSAAAPHAAAVAALMREVDPMLTPAQVTAVLQASAIDILARNTGTATGEGYDNDSGSGLIDADAALTALESIPIWLPDAAARANHAWTFVDAPSGYPDAVVIAGPPTYRGADPGVVRLRNVSGLGFELRFQEWDYRQRDLGDGYHAIEDIGYLVLQPGRHTVSDGSVWEIGTLDLGGTGIWEETHFTQAFAAPPHLFLTVQTANGSQAVSVRARDLRSDGFEAALFEEEALMDGHAIETIGYLAVGSPAASGVLALNGVPVPYLVQTFNGDERWSPVLSQRLKVEEERSADNEVDHVDETLHLLAFRDQILAQQVSNNGGDTTALRRLEPTADAPMEWGVIRGIDHTWRVLPFAKAYTNPVLVAKPASSNGGHPGVIRLQAVSAEHAQLRYQEWNYLDNWHTSEDVFYLVSEAGQHQLGGLTVEAGALVTNALGRAGQWQEVLFNAVFSDPAVLASVMTFEGEDTVTTRIDNRSTLGFDLAMDEQESKSDGHVNETLSWIAVEAGSGTTSEGRRVQVFFDQIDAAATPVLYPAATAHRHPSVIVDITSTFDSDPVFPRHAGPTNTQIGLRLAEEQSADDETGHAFEETAIFVGE